MNTKLTQALLAALMTGALAATGCAESNDPNAGGGGGDAQTRRAAADDRAHLDGNDMGDQLRANLTTDLTGEGRDFAEAYARMPWVHANLAAGDWERALDDLQFVQKQIKDLNGDKDVSPTIKSRIVALTPAVDRLAIQIQKHDGMALKGAVQVIGQFASVTNDPIVLAWINDRTAGGGAGR